MAETAPVGIEDRHIAAASGLPRGSWALIVLGAMIAAALLGLFGGTPSARTHGQSEAATLSVETPRTLRSGMFFETRIRATARLPMADAIVAMPPSLWRSITVNTAIPQAGEEEFSDGMFRFHFGPLEAGEAIELKFDAQINPDLFLGTQGDVVLLDGESPLVRVPVAMKVLP